ncbi:MAG: uroporphyrinogen-III C-methyltransferase [Acidobacteria bacterium]|nr:uroporphyrinogen-III C-methyltransferase [Acidobacteriota bacterium]
MYPVMLNLRGRRSLVVGGGGVVLRKIQALLGEEARVTVIALEPISALEDKANRGEIVLLRRAFAESDVDGFALVFAATNDRAVNERVARAARIRGLWVNVADDPELSDFHLPARVQRGSLQLTIASAGGAPFVVRRLRQMLERKLGPEWSMWIEAAARFRRAVRALAVPHAEAEEKFDRFFAATVDDVRLSARVPVAREEESWLGSPAALPHDAPDRGRESRVTGFVSLVGAGPGDPGLFTMRGHRRLQAADAVVYDRLAATTLPCDLPRETELHCVGKEAGNHPVPQEEINALLLRLAREGKRVVRLKGGDPFIFGRGGEEAEVLKAAGIPFEVVPGVTAGIAVPAYAGIPATHRGESVRVTLLTAHECVKDRESQVRWDLLAQDPHATLVGYMGVSNLATVARRLIDGGMNPATPAGAIQSGTMSRQKAVYSTIGDLPTAADRAKIQPPAIFVVGPTVGHAKALDWFTTRPLFGERLGILDPDAALADALDIAGAEIIDATPPITPAASVVMRTQPLTGWLFKTAEEVELLDEERDNPGFCVDTIAWCLTPNAAARARERGWRCIEELARCPTASAVVTAIAARQTHRGPSKVDCGLQHSPAR